MGDKIYEIKIITGKRRFSGTDANVYIKLYGDRGESTELIKLDNPNIDDFEVGSVDVYKVECASIGRIDKIYIEHDNSGARAGWYLEKIIIYDEEKIYNFSANEWLSQREKNKKSSLLIKEDSIKYKYNLIIETGSIKGAGTTANIDIKLYGKKGNMERFQRINTLNKNDFKRGSLGGYTIYSDKDLGDITQIKLRSDNSGDDPLWYVERIVVNNNNPFILTKWIGEEKHLVSDEFKLSEINLVNTDLISEIQFDDKYGHLKQPSTIPYKIKVKTGEVIYGGTDANVYMKLYGKNGETTFFQLDNEDDNFENGLEGDYIEMLMSFYYKLHNIIPTGNERIRWEEAIRKYAGQEISWDILKNYRKEQSTDEFEIELQDIGELEKIEIYHDNSGSKPGWYLEEVSIVSNDKEYKFTSKRWLVSDINKIVLNIDKAELNIDETKWYTLGFDDTRQVKIENLTISGIDYSIKRKKIRLYKNGFEYSYYSPAGKYKGCGVDAAHSFMGWIVDEIDRSKILNKVEVMDWIDDGAYILLNILTLGLYEIIRRIGDSFDWWDYKDLWKKQYPTTPAQLDTGLKGLLRNTSLSTDVTRYQHIEENEAIESIIHHLEHGMPVVALILEGAHWVTIVGINVCYSDDERKKINLSSTIITVIDLTSGSTYDSTIGNLEIVGWSNFERTIAGTFGATSYDPGTLISIENYDLQLEDRKNDYYLVEITTGAADYAGTDSNVWIKLYGEDGWESEAKYIDTMCDDYENSHVVRGFISNTNEVTNQKYNGKITKIKIGSDGTRENSGWLLKKVEVTRYDELYQIEITDDFTAGVWLEKPTRLTKVILNDRDRSLYKVYIKTGTKPYAGTDSSITIKLFGSNGYDSGEPVNVDDLEIDNFEKGNIDYFEIFSDVYLKAIEKVYIKTDNRGDNSRWDLESIKIVGPIEESRRLPEGYNFAIDGNKRKRTELKIGPDGKTWILKEYLYTDNYVLYDELYEVEPYIFSKEVWMDTSHPERIIFEDTIRKQYEIRVKTGTPVGAGTGAKVEMKIYGSKRVTDFIVLNNSGNDRENGVLDIYSFENKDVGEIEKIEVKHDNTGTYPSWFLQKVEIKKDNKWYNFTAQMWLSEIPGGVTKATILEDDKRVKYIVTVTTADESGAGTDSGIYIRLYGEDGLETSLQLMDDPNYNDFERKSFKSYTIYADEELGEVNKIYLESDVSGSDAKWIVEKVVVNLNSDPSTEYIFERRYKLDSSDKHEYFNRTN